MQTNQSSTTQQFIKIKGVSLYRDHLKLDFNEGCKRNRNEIVCVYPNTETDLFIINEVIGCDVETRSTRDYDVFKEWLKRKKIRSVFLYLYWKTGEPVSTFNTEIMVNI